MTVTAETRTTRRHGGPAPYGYRWDAGQLVPDPAEQGPRWLMLRAQRQGWALQRTADLLTSLGVYTRTGQQWDRRSVHRVISVASLVPDTG